MALLWFVIARIREDVVDIGKEVPPGKLRLDNNLFAVLQCMIDFPNLQFPIKTALIKTQLYFLKSSIRHEIHLNLNETDICHRVDYWRRQRYLIIWLTSRRHSCDMIHNSTPRLRKMLLWLIESGATNYRHWGSNLTMGGSREWEMFW